ncbi:MAG: hypothetical protein LBD30_00390 [Verrucomicrobiales bacterium]|jgi:hypothetical protein|nr:hypothetical protein [Verrucomicrobiales bacterium]
MKPLKSNVFSFRVSDELRDKINWFEKRTGASFTDIMRSAADSVIASVEQRRHLILPFKLLPELEYNELLARIKELEIRTGEKPQKSRRSPSAADAR